MARFGFVVPVYKTEEKYLRECVKSILNQTISDIELILVDDCSPDDCGKICDKIAMEDDRIKVFHHEVNLGLPGARNTGLQHIMAEWVVFVDSDDWVEENMCEIALNYIKEIPADIYFYSGFRNYGDKQVECKYHFDDKELFSTYKERELLQEWIFLDQTKKHIVGVAPIQQAGFKLYNKNFLKTKKIFFTSVRFSEDALMHMDSIEAADRIVYMQQRFYHYRDTPNSMVNSYRVNADKEQLSAVLAMWNFAERAKKGKEFRKLMYIFFFMSMQMCIWQKFFNPQNDAPKKQRMRECEIFFKNKPYCDTLDEIKKMPILRLRRNQIVKYFLMRFNMYDLMVKMRFKANERK